MFDIGSVTSLVFGVVVDVTLACACARRSLTPFGPMFKSFLTLPLAVTAVTASASFISPASTRIFIPFFDTTLNSPASARFCALLKTARTFLISSVLGSDFCSKRESTFFFACASAAAI